MTTESPAPVVVENQPAAVVSEKSVDAATVAVAELKVTTPTEKADPLEKPAVTTEAQPQQETINPIIAAALEKEKETGKKYTIFEHPTPDSKPIPIPELTEEQKEKYSKVLEHFEKIDAIPVSSEKDAAKAELKDYEKMWLTKECFERYLRATKWDVNNAIKRIEATLVWRREYGTDTLAADYIEPENETGKQWTVSFDKNGRPCHCLNPCRQNTDTSPRQIEHLFYKIERDIELMPPGQSTIALVIDFGQLSRSKATPMSTVKQVLHILQEHYPERLGKAIAVNIPWFIAALFKLIMPFIDPVTREKLVLNGDLKEVIPIEQLEKRFGGNLDFEYDHAVYWTHLHEVCGKRKAAYVKRWIDRGSKIGDSEFILRGGEETSAA